LLPHTPGCRVFNTLIGRFPNCHPREFVWFSRPGFKRQKIQFPIVFFYLGPHLDRFADSFCSIGAVCSPVRPYAGFAGGLFQGAAPGAPPEEPLQAAFSSPLAAASVGW